MPIFFGLLFILSACKKGENDPFFSLRTRKARVAGEWRLERGKVIITTVDFANAARLNQVFELNGSRYSLTETGIGNTAYVYNGTYVLKVTFNRDGTFRLYEAFAGDVLDCEGNWYFNGGSGKEKNKESIGLEIRSVKSGKTSGHFLFNQSATKFNFRIKELRNKKMVITTESTVYENAKSAFQQLISCDYTLIQ